MRALDYHHALRAYLLTCERGLRAQVFMCRHALSPLPHTVCVTTWSLPTCFASSVSSFDDTFFSLTATVVEVVQQLYLRFKSLINIFSQ